MSINTLSWHLNKDGLSDTLLKDLIEKANVGSVFDGIFPLQAIPSKLRKKKSFVIIVNIGYHFVTVYATKDFVYYVDSFGKKPPQTLYSSFLDFCERPVYFNSSQVQSKHSTHCGLYSCLFTIYFSKKIPNFTLHFEKKKTLLQKNDKKCIEFLKTLIMK